MISMLQQLYMIPSFRESILAVDDPKKNEVPIEDNLLYQLQCIFAFLHQSEQQYYNPQGFTNAFKDWDGNPTNVLIQMDVDEFFNMFMDKLEFAIKGSPQEKMIQEHFGGQYANELICKGCPHYSESTEPYLAVNLQVKNKKNIKESLEALIEGELLDGDNSYYCEKCDKKVPTLKRTCIKRLPKHLILVMKRFEFDYDYMQKMKVNDYCEFPEEINMEPYTQEGLARREKEAKREESKEDEDDTPIEPKYPLELYNYKISGVLVHSGYAEGGHYYSFIKDREDTEKEKWYEFNDEMVKDFDKDDLESECFGGEEKWGDMMGHFVSLKNTEKNRNAYVLFYERISDQDIPYCDEEEEESAKPADTHSKDKEESDIQMVSENEEMMNEPPLVRHITTNLKIPDEIKEMIEEDNRKYWQYKFMFSQEYSDFILELCSLWNTKHMILLNYDTRNRDYHILNIDEEAYKEEVKSLLTYANNISMHYCPAKNIKFFPEKILLPDEPIDVYQKYGGEKIDAIEFEFFKLITTFYLTVKSRANQKVNVPEIVDLIKAHLNKSLKACKWLISQFCNKEVMYELLVHCPVEDMKKFCVGVIYCAMIRLYEEERQHLDDYWQFKNGTKESFSLSLLGNFINFVISNIFEEKKYAKYKTQYFNILSRFASLGQEARLYLIKAKIIGRLMTFYLEDATLHSEYFMDCSDLSFDENTDPDLGFPTKIENAHISFWEEMIMRKRDAQITEAAQNYTYNWECLSLCLRSCVINTQDSPTYVDDLRYEELEEKELELFNFGPKELVAFIETCDSKVSIKHMGDIILHLCSGNPAMENLLKVNLVSGINDKQLEDLKPYFPIFKRYLFIQDERSEERLADGIRDYFGILKSNIKFGTFMAAFIRFLVKLCNRSRAVCEFLASCPNEWEWVIEWIKKNPNPSKKGQQYRHYTMENALSQYELKRLTSIIEGNIETYEEEYDSDDVELYTQKLYRGKKIDYAHEDETWVPAEITISLDEMSSICYNYGSTRKEPWISIEKDNIAPFGSMTGRHDELAIKASLDEMEQQYRNMPHQDEDAANQMRMSDSNCFSHDGPESVSDD